MKNTKQITNVRNAVKTKLLPWFSENKRTMPWRNNRTPYRVWISELMLQQTRVDQGLNYYTRFVDRYATIYELACADEDEVLKLWQGLGYYSRARNLHETAKKNRKYI